MRSSLHPLFHIHEFDVQALCREAVAKVFADMLDVAGAGEMKKKTRSAINIQDDV
jgi:hypothetical protein